jgi:hypothetical protein
MPKTPTLPPHEPAMWRKLLARAHPDAGGDHELFIWARHLHDVVCASVLTNTPPPRAAQSSTPKEGPARVPFDEHAHDFDDLTRQAVALSNTVDAAFARLLLSLEDCEEEDEDSPLHAQQQLGATYKTLAAIGHAAGMNGAERAHWYKLSEQVPLTQRHAGHILTKLKEGA